MGLDVELDIERYPYVRYNHCRYAVLATIGNYA